MRALKISLLFLLSATIARAQDVTGDVQKIATSTTQGQLLVFSQSLDSLVMPAPKLTVGATTINADTLICPLNTAGIFTIHLIAENTGNLDLASGYKEVFVSNIKGAYKIVGQADLRTFPALLVANTLSKASWTVSVINNTVVVKVTGIAGATTKWSLFRNALFTAL